MQRIFVLGRTTSGVAGDRDGDEDESESSDEKPRNRSGQFVQEIDDEDLLDAIATLSDPTTRDIARALGRSPTGVSNRLDGLREKGALRRREVGDAYLWEIPDDRDLQDG